MLSLLKDKSNVLTLSLKHLNVYLNPDQVKKKTTAEGGTAKTNIHLTFLMNDYESDRDFYFLTGYVCMLYPNTKQNKISKPPLRKHSAYSLHSASP